MGVNDMPYETLNMKIRIADESEVDALAKLWYDGWQDAHADILPAELKQARTLDSFGERLLYLLADTRAAGDVGKPLGFCITKGDELYQMYVSAAARGTGLAARLIEDAEDRLRSSGVETAWLACAIGNERAARFYEKSGWTRAGTMTNRLKLPTGEFLLDVWRYEKKLDQLS